MDKKILKGIKKILNLYNLAIVGCIILIIVSLFIIFKPEKNIVDGVEIISTKVKEDERISEEDARKAAVNQFKKLGENIDKDDLKVTEIQRSGENYYYISSHENTLEIKILGGKITRINSVVVQE